MGNNSSQNDEEEEEYQVLNIRYEDLMFFRETFRKDDLEAFQKRLMEVKTVDTDAYLEFTDALIAVKDDEIYTLDGKRETPDGKDKFEALMESGYVMSMLDFARELKSKTIKSWLKASIKVTEKEVDLSMNPLPDLMDLVSDDWVLPDDVQAHITDSPDILRIPEFAKDIQEGKMPVWFGGISGKCSPKMKAKIKNLINLSGFENETEENGVPFIDCDDPEDFKKYTFLISISTKLAPMKDHELLNLAVMTDPTYHQAMQQFKKNPSHVLKPGEGGWQPRNGRTVRTKAKIFGGLGTTTLQMQFTEIDVEQINNDPTLALGVKWTKALLTERTKQDITKVDSTAKLKVLLLVKQLNHGVLLHSLSITANTLIPMWLVNRVNAKEGGQALQNLVDTTKGSVQWFKEHFSDGRKPDGYNPKIPE